MLHLLNGCIQILRKFKMMTGYTEIVSIEHVWNTFIVPTRVIQCGKFISAIFSYKQLYLRFVIAG